MTSEELAASERCYRSLFAESATAMAISDLDGRCIDANDAFLELIGVPLDELVGQQVSAFTHPDARAENASLFDDLIQGRRSSFSLRKRTLVGSDEVVWARVAVSVIRGAHGDSENLVASIENISERRQSEQRLRRSETLLGVAGELAQVSGWSIEADTGEVEWSDELFTILGAEGSFPPSLDDGVARYVPGSREVIESALDACLSAGTPFDVEVEIDSFDDRRIAARMMGEAERGPDGRVQRILGAFQDVTEVRRAHHRASEFARRLATTVESMTDALYVVDPHWRFTLLNRRAEELLLRSRQELLGRVLWDEFPEARQTVLFDAFHEAMRTGESSVVEEVHYPPLGSWFEVHAHPTSEGLGVYFRDVSERRAARMKLAARESQLARQAALLDAASDAIYVRGLDHVVRYWNDSSIGSTGTTPTRPSVPTSETCSTAATRWNTMQRCSRLPNVSCDASASGPASCPIARGQEPA